MRSRLDVPGLIRRARRVADLSQRDLAAQLGVSQSSVARWETGRGSPSLAAFEWLLELAGWELSVRATDESEVEPLAEDAVRDLARRRFPAHLDVREIVDASSGRVIIGAGRRRTRDVVRSRLGVTPGDHPRLEDLLTARRQAAERRRAALAEGVRLRAEQRRDAARLPGEPASDPGCACGVTCLGSPGCLPGCACNCEPVLSSA